MKIKTGIIAGKGLGDVVANFTQATGLDHLARWYTQVTGRDCGCKARREALNKAVPNVPLTQA